MTARSSTSADTPVLGINQAGIKEILGIWIGETEGARFWLGVLNELRNRGVEDILIVCVDGLTGFTDAIKAVFPETEFNAVLSIRRETR